MDTDNLIQGVTISDVWDVLKKEAENSFIKENKVYALANLKFENAIELAASLRTPDGFKEFQIALKNLIYGNKSFVKYFYNTEFINKLAAETKGSKQIAATFNDALGKGKAGAIKSENIVFTAQ